MASSNQWDETHTCTLVNMAALEAAENANNAKPPEDRVKIKEIGKGKHQVGNAFVDMNLDPYAISNRPESQCIVLGKQETHAIQYYTRAEQAAKAAQWAALKESQN